MKARSNPDKCDHSRNAVIRPPSKSGGYLNDACPFVWCRACGSLWLPKTPTFDRAFERHEKLRGTAPLDGIGNVEGYWILPGDLSIVLAPS